MATTKFTNTAPGARGIQTADRGLVMIEPGATESLSVGDADLRDAKASGFFKIDGKAAKAAGEGEGGGGTAEPSVLDASIADLTASLEKIDDPAEIERLIEQETGGKSRSGALAALNDRLTALNEAE